MASGESGAVLSSADGHPCEHRTSNVEHRTSNEEEESQALGVRGLPQGSSFGQFRACFILRTPETPALWVDAATRKPVGDLPLVYPDGLIVQIHGAQPVALVFSGEVKPGPTRSLVKPGLNLIATPYPGSDHLQGLGLENDLTKNDNPKLADHVWVADDSNGAFAIYFLNQSGHWAVASNRREAAAKIPVGSAILVDRKGPAALFCLGD